MTNNSTKYEDFFSQNNLITSGISMARDYGVNLITKSNPIGSAGLLVANNGILSIGMSVGIQGDSLGKASVKFVGGAASGAICIASGAGAGLATLCSAAGEQLSGLLYDEIASINDYDNFEDF